MAGLHPHRFFYVASLIITILGCAHGNSADSAEVSRLAVIGSHANFVSRTALVRSDAAPKIKKAGYDEKLLARNLSPMPPPSSLYLSEPKKFTFSADHEDMLLQPLLEGIHKGFFVESGAFDGETGSNTLYFERRREWTGLLVEPNPLNIGKLKAKGRQAYVFSGCLSDRVEQDWLGDLLGAKGEHSHLTSMSDSAAKPVPVTCATLPALMKLVGRNTVDFWSLNVEGSEVRVLNGMDFNKVEVGVLLVAAHQAHHIDSLPEITRIMMAHGFREAGRRDRGSAAADLNKPTHITFVNPKYFLKRGLRIPTGGEQPVVANHVKADQVMLMKLLAAKPATTAQNSTVTVTSDPLLSRWASIPLILVIAAMSIACCLKPDVKGPADC